REELAANVFELVQPRHRHAGISHNGAAPLGEGLRIEKAKRRRAVAHDERAIVVRQTPAFAPVAERLLRSERRAVVAEGDLRPPRQLKEVVVPDRDPLAEIFRREIASLKDLAGLDLHFPDGRPSVETGALVKE